MSDRYTLSETGEPVPAPDLLDWARWFEKAERHVARETVGDFWVSTIFLGLNHAMGDGEPLLWETMVFPGDGSPHNRWEEQWAERCGGNRENAKAMHERGVQWAKSQISTPTGSAASLTAAKV